MAKVLMINGSPDPAGCIHTAMEEAAAIFAEQGIETEELQIGNRDIRGCIACRKGLPLSALFCFHKNPLDQVFFCHGVICTAYANVNCAAIDSDDRHMLFLRRIRCIGYKFCHGLSATDHINVGIMDHADQVAAMVTSEKFSHTGLLSIQRLSAF